MNDFVLQALRIAVPYVLAALAGVVSERAGVINIALEALLLAGAFGAVLGSHFTGSPALGLLAGLALALAVAGVHALATVRFRASHIVAGLALNLLLVGATRFALVLLFDSSSNSPRVAVWSPGALSGLALTAALTALVHLGLARTAFGLRLRACGEHPEAAASVGVSVARVRALAVLGAGLLGGLGGVWLAFDQGQFVDLMSNGRGYIALAAVVFGRWRPVPAALACLLFGVAEAAQLGLQARGAGQLGPLVQTLPYVVTMLAIAGVVGRARAPAALGRPFVRG